MPVQEEAKAKFNESVEIAINLGTDPRRGDQQVRGAVVLPHGTGSDARVAVFAEDEAAETARSAGEACLLLAESCSTAWKGKEVLQSCSLTSPAALCALQCLQRTRPLSGRQRR